MGTVAEVDNSSEEGDYVQMQTPSVTVRYGEHAAFSEHEDGNFYADASDIICDGTGTSTLDVIPTCSSPESTMHMMAEPHEDTPSSQAMTAETQVGIGDGNTV